ncbi:MAG TPA: beta-galactosidase [Oscillospiraceae bacterium]|nr:beta-galactosidase [Oscillospiraceae bacterium]
MNIGVDYYPEHWDKSLWVADADLMKKTGVSIVRMSEFAWCRLEPRDGKFDFQWLDKIIGIFAERNISVVLCTPTNCPPLWFYEKYPDAVQTERDGKKIATGIRGHRCINNPDFLRYADRIVETMTKRYADNKSVIAWQIDNEMEANFCFCENCIEKYRKWLKKKYKNLEELNNAYGNNVWSGEYSSWEQIKPPYGSYPNAWLNPAFMLDFNRYASDDMVAHINHQAEIIRRNCPNTQITTNAWFCENMPNFYDQFAGLDFLSYDNYPVTKIPENAEQCYSHAFHLDLMRGVKQDKFWIMEQLSGGLGCWAPMARTTYPGMIKGYSLQAFAHGADTVVHFRWRTAVSGAEMHWHGLIDHSNVPGRRFEEFSQLCEEAKTLKVLQETEIKSDVAILYYPDNEYAFKLQPQTNGMYYLEQLMLIHRAFTKYGINVDIISEKADFSKYKIIAAPEMYITDETVANRIYEFAENGGGVILTNRSGVKDINNNCIMSLLPTVYRQLAGVYVEEYDPIGYSSAEIKYDDGETYKCRQWCDVIHTETATAIAVYDSEFYKGKPAITRNSYGKGVAYYIGTVCEKSLYNRLIHDILIEMKMEIIEGLPDDVEVTTRTSDKLSARLIFNNTDKNQSFSISKEEISLAPFEMKIDIK